MWVFLIPMAIISASLWRILDSYMIITPWSAACFSIDPSRESSDCPRLIRCIKGWMRFRYRILMMGLKSFEPTRVLYKNWFGYWYFLEYQAHLHRKSNFPKIENCWCVYRRSFCVHALQHQILPALSWWQPSDRIFRRLIFLFPPWMKYWA